MTMPTSMPHRRSIVHSAAVVGAALVWGLVEVVALARSRWVRSRDASR